MDVNTIQHSFYLELTISEINRQIDNLTGLLTPDDKINYTAELEELKTKIERLIE